MKILALEQEIPGSIKKQFALHSVDEAARVWQLYQAGIIREMHFRHDRSDAVLILEASSPEEAQAALDTLPLVKAGLIRFEIIPLVPYPGLARLFRGDQKACLAETGGS